jgi:hypothetical protein
MNVHDHAVPAFVPMQYMEIGDQEAIDMLRKLTRVDVKLPPASPLSQGNPISTALVGPGPEELAAYPPEAPVLILLHSFDSSCLEFRRLYPLISSQLPVYAVDLVGWGFTDVSYLHKNITLTPEDKRNHLKVCLPEH